MRAVMLDRASLGDDQLDFSALEAEFDELVSFDGTAEEQTADRLAGFDVWVTNKVRITAQHFAANSGVRLVLVVATGTDNVDLDAAKSAGVAVCNVRAYGIPSVAQHTMMLILALATGFERYRDDVRAGAWSQSQRFCLMDHPAMELSGKTLGVMGAGDLGGAVAALGEAFGMRVVLWDRQGTGAPGRLPLDQLLQQVDVMSIHCPLTPATRGIIDAQALATMKPTAFVINTARGGIVDEDALCEALDNGVIAGAAFDVLSTEPPPVEHPLLKPRSNFILTPHSAWLARESRQRMIRELALNMAAFKAGEPRNRVV